MNLNRSLKTNQKLKVCPSRPAHSRLVQAMSLVEQLVAVAIGALVIGAIAVGSTTASYWFGALANYVDMDSKSRNALNQMTLKIRQAGALTEFSPSHLKFAVLGQTNSFLVYDWDSATGSLTELNTADSTTKTLLTECDRLAFSLYDFSSAPTTNLAKTKGLSVNWNSTRTIVGRKTTEEMQQALIVLRNKRS